MIRTEPPTGEGQAQEHEKPGHQQCRGHRAGGEREAVSDAVQQDGRSVGRLGRPPGHEAGEEQGHHDREDEGHHSQPAQDARRRVDAASDRHRSGGGQHNGDEGRQADHDEGCAVDGQPAVAVVPAEVVGPGQSTAQEEGREHRSEAGASNGPAHGVPPPGPDEPDERRHGRQCRERDDGAAQHPEHRHRVEARARRQPFDGRRPDPPVVGELCEDGAGDQEEGPAAQDEDGARPQLLRRLGRRSDEPGRAGPFRQAAADQAQTGAHGHIARRRVRVLQQGRHLTAVPGPPFPGVPADEALVTILAHESSPMAGPLAPIPRRSAPSSASRRMSSTAPSRAIRPAPVIR